ncbi:hypothetical protein MVEN_00480500 [Mycena venus]|uniref:Uncharacterized protein n=1 Tax=Mycena venus TaxID=2733690 RepID=A0A8H7DBJ3_9AGAR|nr:hypothetical protein MVEN_00480500 [Mycena venus]
MLFSAILFTACAVAVPLNSRQTAPSPSPLKCSNSTAATDVGAGIQGTQFILTEINAFDGVADPRPIFSAQLALLDAKPIASQLGSLALFPTIAPTNPPTATAVEDLTNALAQVQKFVANITVGPPGVTAIIANNTAALENAKRNLNIALASLPNLGCTSTGA